MGRQLLVQLDSRIRSGRTQHRPRGEAGVGGADPRSNNLAGLNVRICGEGDSH